MNVARADDVEIFPEEALSVYKRLHELFEDLISDIH